MIIRRIMQGFGVAGIIEIQLIPEELEQAYMEKEKEYKMDDVKDAVQQAYEWEVINRQDYELVIQNEKFQKMILEEYEKRFSCNIPENLTWEEAVKEVLKEIKIEHGDE